MTDTADPTAQEWIEALPPGSCFWSRELPGKPSTARAVVSRLVADPGSALVRAAPGLYWKGYPEGHRLHHAKPYETAVAIVYAGPGAGYGGWSAVHALGWAHQPTHRTELAVLGRRQLPVRHVRYTRRRNSRRRELNTVEVSVLEAVAMRDYIEYPWQECMRRLAKGDSGLYVGGSAGVFRPDVMAWAAEADDLATPDLLHTAGQMTRELPETVQPAETAAAAP